MSDRQLYRIKRGSYTRRDGPESNITDSLGKVTSTQKAHVTYTAKTIANMAAKDEVYMTDREADLFGRHKLTRLFPDEIKTSEGNDGKPLKGKTVPGDSKTRAAKLQPVTEEEDDGKTAAMILALIKKGEKAKTPKEKRDFAKEVGNADLIEEVPDKHGDILDALKELA